MRDSAPKPRRRRPIAEVVTVAPLPVCEEEPTLWANDTWAQPANCAAPLDPYDLDEGICGEVFTPVGNERTYSDKCSEKLERAGICRRIKIYRWKHRERLWLERNPPKNCKAPVDLDDPTKGICGEVFRGRGSTCRDPECDRKFKLLQGRKNSNKFYNGHKQLCLDRSAAWEKKDREANPEKYRKMIICSSCQAKFPCFPGPPGLLFDLCADCRLDETNPRVRAAAEQRRIQMALATRKSRKKKKAKQAAKG